MPIAPPDIGPATAPNAAPREPTFRERKAAQLREERGTRQEQPTADQDPPRRVERDERTLRQAAGSAAQDLDQDVPEVEADDEYEDGGEGELFDDGDDATLGDDDPDATEETHDWEKRYNDLRSEYDRVTGTRKEMEQEHAETMGETLRLKFELEDRLQEAVGRAEYMANVMSGNAARFRNINWSQVPAEKLAEVQSQAQQALAMEQQAKSAWQQIKSQSDEAKAHMKQREAAIAKTRLKRTIGLNNEVYSKLREHAVSLGMAPDTFNELTDPVIIEGLHALMQMQTAGNTVQTSNKRRPNAPRNRTGARAPRDAQGKFAKAKVEPNVRGSFAEKHRHRLAMERQGR